MQIISPKFSNKRNCEKCGKHLITSKRFCSLVCKAESQKKQINIVCFGCFRIYKILPYLKRKTNYCSRNCYWDSTRKKKKCICDFCKKEFLANNYLVQQGYGIYCSRECQHKAYPKKAEKICLQCNNNYRVSPTRAEKSKFCNKKCANDYMRDYVKRICENCKKQFELPRSDLNRGRGLFCTRECYIEYKGETSIEKKVRQVLERAKIKFIQEAKFDLYRTDFFLKEQNVALECDGEYWHSQPWSSERDTRKDVFLANKGIKVIRIPEEIIRNLSEDKLKPYIVSLL